MVGNKTCLQFLRGKCTYGKHCKFRHDTNAQVSNPESGATRTKNICRAFLSPAGCQFGDHCKFAHDKAAGPMKGALSSGTTPSDRRNLQEWKYGIPLALDRARPMNEHQLQKFFELASELVTKDDETRQVVVGKLASDCGLYRLNEAVGLLTAEDLSVAEQKVLILGLFLPVCRIFSVREVRNSFTMGEQVHRIIHWLFGPGGARAIPIFRATVTVLVDMLQSPDEDQSMQTTISHLEAFAALLNITAKLVSSARADPALKELMDVLLAAVKPEVLNISSVGVKARGYLEQLQRLLGIGGKSLESNTKTLSVIPKPRFRLQQDGPGSLSTEGPRSDNDNEHISQIKLMPTASEVHSSRSEYLPVNDLRELHLAGVEGLIDRQFRLLREDTVGQLRDAVRMEILRQQTVTEPGSLPRVDSQGVRTHIYRNGRILDLRVSWRSGLEFLYCFEQPPQLQGRPEVNRKRWWEASKRLQPETLVCLLDASNTLTFATIVDRDLSDKKRPDGEVPIGRQTNLYSDPDWAYVSLVLVESQKGELLTLFEILGRQDNTDTLVEFPGVLLASFYPTLTALQRMIISADMPFSDILASTRKMAGLLDVPPPAYAMEAGFSFDMKAIVSRGDPVRLFVQGQFDTALLHSRSTLDTAQAKAVVHALSHSLAIIQGPPGTGKSYTGGCLIKVLVDNQETAELGPILCVTYTNHALDQLMEHLVQAGVDQMIRIGSRSKSEVLENLNLRAVRDRVHITGQERRLRYVRAESMNTDANVLTELIQERRSAGTLASLANYLRANYPDQHQQLFSLQEEDGFTEVRRRPYGRFHQWFRPPQDEAPLARETPRSLDELIKSSVWSMTVEERQMILNRWSVEIRSEVEMKISSTTEDFLEKKQQKDDLNNELDLRALKAAKVIGVTTSGLARIVELLSKLESKVLLCEEAGEVLEAHSLTTLLPSIQHAILIGDHLQLRPSIQNYELQRENPRGRQYSFDVSLFERLVDPQESNTGVVPFCTLETQRRMHPSIAGLIRSTLYPRLRDFDNVRDYPPVTGLRRRLYWLDHENREDNSGTEEHQTTSHSNTWEVEMTAALVSHLVKQGAYCSSDIAVLSPYVLQVKKLRQRLSASFEVIVDERDLQALAAQGLGSDLHEDDEGFPHVATARKGNLLSAVRVATIDNFQGEEAKIVIVSLVRSNDAGKCGFLRTTNRINVTLSRAQHGMYIIGSSKTAGSAPMWKQVRNILEEDGNIGPTLSLQCPRHEDTPIPVSTPEDFLLLSPEGGCSLECGKRLKCGHSCPSSCHSHHLHDSFSCPEDCPRSLKGCDHACPLKCGDSCPKKCRVEINNVAMPCGHTPTLECWEAQHPKTAKCKIQVPKTMPACQHDIIVACHDRDSKDVRCTARCGATLKCGHVCERACNACRHFDPESETIAWENHGVCAQKCGRDYTTCRHSCSKTCHGDEPCELCQSPCEVRCAHSRCSRRCSEPCAPCAETYCDNVCPHSGCSMPCSAPCDAIPCSKRCTKTLDCTHQCPSLCSEECPPAEYCQICASSAIKEIRADLLVYEQYQQIDLDESPCLFLPCGHIFTVESLDGLMNMSKHYKVDGDGVPVALQASSEPFSVEELKVCPDCRGPLRTVRRYGRLVRRALLDESTKKFIVWANKSYVELYKELLHAPVTEDSVSFAPLQIHKKYFPRNIDLTGSRDRQIRVLSKENPLRDIIGKLLKLRSRISAYVAQVRAEEQPFQRVRELVQHKRRQNESTSEFDFDRTILQTRSYILASALLLRCDMDLVSKVLTTYKDSPKHPGRGVLTVSLEANMNDCETLIDAAREAKQPRQETEGHVLLARFAALERSTGGGSTNPIDEAAAQATSSRLEDLKIKGVRHLDDADELCRKYSGSTSGMQDDIEEVRVMLRESTFYAPVTNEETLQVLAAMATEFSGTGHWYYCENGHPFTVGECGMPMETSRCPQCDAPVGGRNHQAVAGVSRAGELEGMLRNMRV